MIEGTDWLQAREARRAWALGASDPWRAWAFRDADDLVAVADAALGGVVAPTPEALRAVLGAVAVPPPSGARSPAEWRRWAGRHATDVPHDDAHIAAWRRARLDAVGARIEARERHAWREVPYPDDPKGDARAAALWAAWFTGDPWSGRSAWEKLLLPHAARAFRGVCEARRLPQEVRRRVLDDLREGFFWALLGAGGDAAPAWVDLALRTLETAGPGPVDALVAVLDRDGWDRVGRCIATRGTWATTIAAWQHDRAEPLARARAVSSTAGARPSLAEPLLDLHVALRCLERLADAPESSLWPTVRQNRGRGRGRLRAVLADRPDRLMEPLLALPGLLARTRAAVRRFAWSWAWRELATDFTFDAGRAGPAPCLETLDAPPPLEAAERDAMKTWVFLVLLRGRDAHLARWVRTGSTGDRDSTWARLLSDACPPCLVDDPSTSGRSRTYHRLRTELAEGLDTLLAELTPALHDLAALPTGRTLRTAFEARFAPTWSEQVPLPKSGFPTFHRHAQALVRAFDAPEDPAGIGDAGPHASTGPETLP